MKFGYARVSTEEQKLDRQIEALEKEGCEVIFSDKWTGSTKDRPELMELFSVMRKGDIIVISDLTRFSRSMKDLFELIDIVKERGVFLKSLKDTWLDITDDSPYAVFLLQIMSAVAELERNITRQRMMEGIAIARAKGKYKGRPKTFTMNNKRLSHAIDLYENSKGTLTVKEACTMTGISEATFYRNWKQRKLEIAYNELEESKN